MHDDAAGSLPGTVEKIIKPIIVDGLPIFIRREIGLQINGIAAQHAGYFWDEPERGLAPNDMPVVPHASEI